MFDRFTDRSRKVMGLARQEAGRLSHQYIGTEHILLGLIAEGSGVAANVLRNLKVDPDRVRVEVEKLVQNGPIMVTMGQLPFTPRAKRMLELSAEAADDLRHNYIGTEHLLLALIAEGEGAGAAALRAVGLTLKAAQAETLELLGADIQSLRSGNPHPADFTTFDGYQEFTRTTAVYPGVSEKGFLSANYCTLGLVGEAGEVAEKMKKRFRLGGVEAFKPGSTVLYVKTGQRETYEEFIDAVKMEIGDVLWYVAGLSAEFGFSLSDIAKTNVEKLTGRKRDGTLKGSGDNR